MPLINCKEELKLKYCVLDAAGAENANANNIVNNIIFTIKNTHKRNILALTLSTKDNQTLSKLLSIGVEGSLYWNE